MPSINMIASRRVEKRRQEQNIRKLVYAITAEIAVVIVVVTVLTMRVMAVKNDIQDFTQQAAKLQPKVTQIQTLEQETLKLKPKVETLDGAKSDTLFWYSNLYTVTKSLPAKTWLTSMGTVGSGGVPGAVGGTDPSLNIAGVALDYATVGTTVLNMNQSPRLDHVEVGGVTLNKIGDRDTVAFTMIVHLKPQTPAGSPQGGANDVKKS